MSTKMQEKISAVKQYDLFVGIDCGVHTGFAVWNPKEKTFDSIKTLKIHQAIFQVLELSKTKNIKVIVEDARKRKWIPKEYGNARLQGAGSVKRDASVWEGFLEEYEIDFEMTAPKEGITKWNSKTFKEVTKFPYSTTEHSRDAGLLVFQRK